MTSESNIVQPTESMKDVKMDESDILQLKCFDTTKMVKYPKILIIGRKNTGKSILCKNLIEQQHYDEGTLVTCKKIINPDVLCNMPIFKDSTKKCDELSDTIKEHLEKAKKSIENKENKSFVFVIDDAVASRSTIFTDQAFLELIYSGKHFNTTVIWTMQFPLGITPELRVGFDYVFLMEEDFTDNKKRLYDHYCGMFPSYASFKHVFDFITKDFTAFVILNSSGCSTFCDKVQWYKANSSDTKPKEINVTELNDAVKKSLTEECCEESENEEEEDKVKVSICCRAITWIAGWFR